MKNNIYLDGKDLYLSYHYLRKNNISSKTIQDWKQDNRGIRITIENEVYVLYKSIPNRTRKKLLPADKIISQESNRNSYTRITEVLKEAKYFQHSKYKCFYENDSALTTEQVTRFCQLHSVFQRIIDLKEAEGSRDLKNLYEVFNDLFPNKYSSKHALSNSIRKAMANGIIYVAMDKRVFGNNNEQTSQKISPVTQYWMANLIAHPRKFSSPKILELISIACDEKGYSKPSLSWIKKHRLRLLKNVDIYQSRYGQQEVNKKMPYVTLKSASFANDQWQMDGWTLPFWVDNEKKFQRYVLVRLIDNNSKKIVGYSVGKSENGSLIMEAIRDAVNNTGVLPYEILTDNHSFNQTKEALNLQSLLSKKGTRWIVTQNPQYKSIVERYNRHLDNLCKDHYGYLGEGIRSKSIDAIAKPEMVDQYLKNHLSEEENKAIAIEVVERYNKKTAINGKSPNDLYNENANPYPIQANIFDRAELLTTQTESKINRRQITIKKGIEKYEFQLPSHLYMQYNDTVVIIRYEDLRDGIYLFDKKTGEAIIELHLKNKINGAKINQSDTDIMALNKHAGRIKSIKTKAAKQLKDITERALSIDPDAYSILNPLTTPKNVLQELQQDADFKRTAEAKGLVFSTLQVPDRYNPGVTTSLQPKKRETNPFRIDNNKIEIIDPKKDIDNNDD
jgi:hypothetical protein